MRSTLIFLLSLSFGVLAKDVYIIGFGSCLDQRNAQEIFTSIKKENLDHFIFLGDNVYGDVPNAKNLEKLQLAYQKQSELIPNWLRDIEIDAIWDDHDYGLNDGGGSFVLKEEAQKLFLKFWDIPITDQRQQQTGTYFSKNINLGNKKVVIIGLDTRYFRSDLKGKRNEYQPNIDPDATILGTTQWDWLAQQITKKADLVILLSSIQILPTKHRFEKWSNFPNEREKLINLILRSPNASNTVIVSGDRHRGALYEYKNIYELTASALNKVNSTNEEEDPLLIGSTFPELNYGILEINPTQNHINIMLKDFNGEILVQKSMDI
jgi:alkaline phosphatase D